MIRLGSTKSIRRSPSDLDAIRRLCAVVFFNLMFTKKSRKTAYEALSRIKTGGKKSISKRAYKGGDGRYRGVELVGGWSRQDQHVFLILEM